MNQVRFAGLDGGGCDFAADRDGRFAVRMHQVRFAGHDDVSLFLDGGRGAEEVFQHGDPHEERDADGLFHILFADVGRQQFFGLESERELTGNGARIAEFIAAVAAFGHGLGKQVVGEDHAAVVRGIEFLRGRDLSVRRDVVLRCAEADHRVDNRERQAAVRAFHDVRAVVGILVDVLIAGRERGGVDFRQMRVQRGRVINRRIHEREVGVRREFCVAGLLEHADEAHVELRSREERAVAPRGGEMLGDVGEFRRAADQFEDGFGGEHFSGTVSGGEEVQAGTVFPGEVIQPDVAQVAFADLIVVEAQIDLRHGTVEVFDPREDRQSGLLVVLPVDRVGVLVQVGTAFGRFHRAIIDEAHDIFCGAVAGIVSDFRDAGALDDGAVLFLARLVKPGDQLVHVRDEVLAGRNHDHLSLCLRVVHPVDFGRDAVTFDRCLDERADVGRLEVFEFVDFADDVDLAVVLKETDGPDFLFFLCLAVQERRTCDACRQESGENMFSVVHG